MFRKYALDQGFFVTLRGTASAGGRKFSPVTTDFPVFSSSALRACLAIAPPLPAAAAFSVMPVASSVSAICRVESSASAVALHNPH